MGGSMMHRLEVRRRVEVNEVKELLLRVDWEVGARCEAEVWVSEEGVWMFDAFFAFEGRLMHGWD